MENSLVFSGTGFCIYFGTKYWIQWCRHSLVAGSQEVGGYETVIDKLGARWRIHMSSKALKKKYLIHDAMVINDIPSQPFTCHASEEEFYSRYNFVTKEWKCRENDIFVSTFAKCGTTWTEQIILLLMCGGDPTKLPSSSQNSYVPGSNTLGKVWPLHRIGPSKGQMWGGESMNWVSERKSKHWKLLECEEFENLPFRRVMKSHSVYNQFPGLEDGKIPKGVKVVVTARNCFDACVSLYHFHNMLEKGVPFDAFARAYALGLVEDGSWFEWYKTWGKEQALQSDSVLLVYFEDLKKDPRAQITRIAKFLDLSCSEDLLDCVIAGSSFKSMKQKSEDPRKFFRGGRIGDNTKYFSPKMKLEFTRILCQSGMDDFLLSYKSELSSILDAKI